jgi:hypothetical protein
MNPTCVSRFLARLAPLALVFAVAAHAADTTPPAPDRLTPARERIAQKDWAGAIAALKQVEDTKSADWNNLMGYSLRKGPNPDLAAAERHYDAALQIDPKHRGALEYSGELFLMTNRLALAEKRLAELDKACFLPCDEYKDLKQAVQRYKDNGNRWVASTTGW